MNKTDFESKPAAGKVDLDAELQQLTTTVEKQKDETPKAAIPGEFLAKGKDAEKEASDAMQSILSNIAPAPEVLDVEKEMYLKSVLNDVPVELELSGFGGKLKMVFRSRTPEETTAIFKQLQSDLKNKRFELELEYQTRLRNYCLAVQTVSINGEKQPDYSSFPVSKENMDAGIGPIYLAAEKYRSLKNEYIVVAQISLLSLFERKVALMGSKILDGDFWNPAGSS